MLIDTHTHIDGERFDADRLATLDRARGAGVRAMINVGCDVDNSRRALGLARTHTDVFATAGIHPHEAKTAGAFEAALLELLADPRCVAVGECGLDYHYDHSRRDVQREVFARQMTLAHQVKKPLVLHVREAFDDAMAMLKDHNASAVGGVFHCFTGTWQEAERALELGFYLSFPGVVTFQNATALVEAAKLAPSDRILVETDAPYMAPVPERGKRNEPAFVAHTARKIADVRGEDYAQFVKASGENAVRLFGLPLADVNC